jgi:hypothetical protein
MAERILLTTSEEWKAIPFAPHYEVSSFGQVRTYWIRGGAGRGRLYKHPRLMTPIVKKRGKGYRNVGLQIDGRRRDFRVNRLVALVFIRNPDNKPEVNHKDLDKLNDTVGNLEWATSQENIDHAIFNGARDSVGEANPKAKLTEEQVRAIREEWQCPCVFQRDGRKPKGCPHGASSRALADKYGITQTHILYILRGMSWTQAA